jgi:photosystem II stability/assembly factor-like uncharacterized protein
MLALVAVVLAFAALRNTRSTVTPTPLASALTTPTDEPNDKDKNGGTDLEDALPDEIEPPLLMVSDTVAYRARTGTCLGGSTLERSTDGGRRWKPATSPAPAVLSISSVGGDAVDIVGADDRCKVRVWSSPDQGDTWSEPASASGLFSRVPDDPRRLSTPNGEVKNPCPDRTVAPISFEGISDLDAAVLCTSGDVLTTADAGDTWSSGEPVAGGQALAFEGPALGWALKRDSDRCPGYELVNTQDGAQTWQSGGCVGLEVIADSRQLPSLSFADPELGMADLAGDVLVTVDSGLTWREAR